VNARVNTGTTLEDSGPTDVPIYNLAGVKVLDGNADMWSGGSLDALITEVDGDATPSYGWWTGTNADGTTSATGYLGNGEEPNFPNYVEGDSDDLTGYINKGNGWYNHTKLLLGISSVITGTTTPAADPEITSITVDSGIATIIMKGEPGTPYVCKSSTTLSGFSEVTILSGTLTPDGGGNATFTVAAADAKRFYLVAE